MSGCWGLFLALSQPQGSALTESVKYTDKNRKLHLGKGTKGRARKFSNTQDYRENCFVGDT